MEKPIEVLLKCLSSVTVLSFGIGTSKIGNFLGSRKAYFQFEDSPKVPENRFPLMIRLQESANQSS